MGKETDIINLVIKDTDKIDVKSNIVVIDTATILEITDSAIIGKYVDNSLLIAFYSVNKVKDVDFFK